MRLFEILKVKGSHVHTICPEATLEEAIRDLATHNVGALVVCQRDLKEGEKLVGIVSERDIVRFLAVRPCELAQTSVRDVMSTELITGTPDDTVEATMSRMTSSRIRHVPILFEDRMVGMISIGDVVKSQIQELAVENEFMKNYITG